MHRASNSLSSLGRTPSASLPLKLVDDSVHILLCDPLLLLLFLQRLHIPITTNISNIPAYDGALQLVK